MSLSGIQHGEFDTLSVGGSDIHVLISTGGVDAYSKTETNNLLSAKTDTSTTNTLQTLVNTKIDSSALTPYSTTAQMKTALVAKQDNLSDSGTGTQQILDGTTVKRISAGTNVAVTADSNQVTVGLAGVYSQAAVNALLGSYVLSSALSSGYYTQSQVDAAISTSVNALIGGAPGLLNTLDELAAAISDDENYAAGVTSALAGKNATLSNGAAGNEEILSGAVIKRLSATSPITLSSDVNAITIAAPGLQSALSNGATGDEGILTGSVLKKLTGGTRITLSSDSNAISISTSAVDGAGAVAAVEAVSTLTLSDQLKINTSGSVTEELYVTGKIRCTSEARFNYMRIFSPGSACGILQHSSLSTADQTSFAVRQHSSGYSSFNSASGTVMTFSHGNTEHSRFRDGSLLLGSTAATSHKLKVTGTAEITGDVTCPNLAAQQWDSVTQASAYTASSGTWTSQTGNYSPLQNSVSATGRLYNATSSGAASETVTFAWPSGMRSCTLLLWKWYNGGECQVFVSNGTYERLTTVFDSGQDYSQSSLSSSYGGPDGVTFLCIASGWQDWATHVVIKPQFGRLHFYALCWSKQEMPVNPYSSSIYAPGTITAETARCSRIGSTDWAAWGHSNQAVTTAGSAFLTDSTGAYTQINVPSSSGEIRLNVNDTTHLYLNSSQGVTTDLDWTITGSGSTLTCPNLSVSGTKSWSIPHPTRPGKRLQHGCVEGAEQGVNLYRLTCEPTEAGSSDWALPEWYEHVNQDNAQCWCQADEHFGRAYAKLVEGSLQLTCETPGRYHVLVLATRAGDFGWQLEPDA